MKKHIPTYPFPVNELYKTVKLAVEETMDVIQAPDALVATSFLTAMSIACQSDIDVMLPYGSTTPCALYLATVAESGERKTATDKYVMKPIYDYELAHSLAQEAAMERHELDHSYWAIENKALARLISRSFTNGEDTSELRLRFDKHKASEPKKPAYTRMIIQDATERGLINAVQGDSKSIAMLSDEGATLLKSGAFKNAASLNKLWDGPLLMLLDRADEIVRATNPRLTLSFMIQEDLLLDFLTGPKNAARASGFLARFLFCHPESTQGYRMPNEITDGDPALGVHISAFHKRMNDLQEARDKRHAEGDVSKKVLRFSSDAKILWVQHQEMLEPKLAKGCVYEDIRDFASKAMEISSRVAGILHHFEGIDGDLIERATLQRAINIVSFYLDEFREEFGGHNNLPEDEKDARALFKYLDTKYWDRYRNRAYRNDVRKSGPIRNQGRFDAALSLLQDDGVVRVVNDSLFKPKSKLVIELNPSFFGRNKPL